MDIPAESPKAWNETEPCLPAAYFVSDAHLGIQFPFAARREAYLLEFLHRISDHATHLFILGDLFDFWIEYDHAIRPDYFDTLWALKSLSHAGVELNYIAGNHDFALGPFLRDKINLRIHPERFEIHLQGRSLLLVHGDDLLSRGSHYKTLRNLLRNPLCQKLYKLLHPNLGVPLGTFFSGFSRKYRQHKDRERQKIAYRNWALEKIDAGFDMVLLGHTHAAEFVRSGKGIYCNTGNWMGDYTFAKLEKGVLTLECFEPRIP